MNLLSNAVKFTTNGKVIKVCHKLKGDKIRKTLVVTISDQGVGMN